MATTPKTTRRPKRAARPSGLIPLSLNLPPEIMDGLDAWVATLNERLAGPHWSRTAVIRTVLARALAERGKKGLDP
jgi:hypothetical protein